MDKADTIETPSELSGSPENWSSNFRRYIIPADFPAKSASRQIRGLACCENPGLNILSLSFHSGALSYCKHAHVFILRTKSARSRFDLLMPSKLSQRQHPTANTLPVSSSCGIMVLSTARRLKTLNPHLIEVIWASNLFLKREKADIMTGNRKERQGWQCECNWTTGG